MILSTGSYENRSMGLVLSKKKQKGAKCAEYRKMPTTIHRRTQIVEKIWFFRKSLLPDDIVIHLADFLCLTPEQVAELRNIASIDSVFGKVLLELDQCRIFQVNSRIERIVMVSKKHIYTCLCCQKNCHYTCCQEAQQVPVDCKVDGIEDNGNYVCKRCYQKKMLKCEVHMNSDIKELEPIPAYFGGETFMRLLKKQIYEQFAALPPNVVLSLQSEKIINEALDPKKFEVTAETIPLLRALPLENYICIEAKIELN